MWGEVATKRTPSCRLIYSSGVRFVARLCAGEILRVESPRLVVGNSLNTKNPQWSKQPRGLSSILVANQGLEPRTHGL